MGAEVSCDEKRLSQLFAEANCACLELESATEFEPFLAKLLDFIVQNPACHSTAQLLLVNGIGDGTVEWETAAYLMHELRWPEVRERVAVMLASAADWREKTALSHVLSAFHEDWPDAVGYERWRAVKRKPPSEAS